MNEDDFILVAAILFCAIVMTTCLGMCISMQPKHAEVTRAD